jgi:D-alanyl-D-alanine carboxypeptidase
MIRRSMTVLALAACTFAPLAFAAAKPATSADNNANIAPAKGSMVHVTLKNRSNMTQNLTIQGRQVVLAANEQQVVDVPAGTQVLGADKTVKLTIVKEYNGAVASFNN